MCIGVLGGSLRLCGVCSASFYLVVKFVVICQATCHYVLNERVFSVYLHVVLHVGGYACASKAVCQRVSVRCTPAKFSILKVRWRTFCLSLPHSFYSFCLLRWTYSGTLSLIGGFRMLGMLQRGLSCTFSAAWLHNREEFFQHKD